MMYPNRQQIECIEPDLKVLRRILKLKINIMPPELEKNLRIITKIWIWLSWLELYFTDFWLDLSFLFPFF